ncbi:MAG: hypothetical protein OIF48_02450, partial [Silicimonas sp.]|nr:hypothetical protein [Silicimonas sp.]
MGMNEQVSTTETVTSARHDSVLVITFENPPTGALSGPVRAALMSEIGAAAAVDAVAAVVIT